DRVLECRVPDIRVRVVRVIELDGVAAGRARLGVVGCGADAEIEGHRPAAGGRVGGSVARIAGAGDRLVLRSAERANRDLDLLRIARGRVDEERMGPDLAVQEGVDLED